MTRALKLARAARQDLKSIWKDSNERWGSAQADRYVRAINDVFARLLAEPQRARPREDVGPGYLDYPVGSHLIFVRIDETHVYVVRILHARMDFKRHL